jgi:general secretion pathway protein M
MMALWTDRSPRERVMLAGLGLLALVWLAVAGIWQPLVAHRASLASQIARYDTAARMLTNPAQTTTPTDPRPVPVIITESAATFQLTIRRLQPTGDQVQIVLEDAPFEAVILWIDALATDHALTLQSLDLIRRPAPGMVAATLTVAR